MVALSKQLQKTGKKTNKAAKVVKNNAMLVSSGQLPNSIVLT